MKSKITRMKPDEVGSMTFKEVKLILKKDFANLETVGEEGTSFFVVTDFKYSDIEKPLLVVGDFKGEWKNHVRESVKPPSKTSAYGSCHLSDGGKTLNLNIEKGKAKPKAIEKALTKYKLLPNSIEKLVFKEVTVEETEGEEDLDSMNTAKEDQKDKVFSQIVVGIKEYKQMLSEDTEERSSKIQALTELIRQWEEANKEKLTDKTVAEKNNKLQGLKEELNTQSLNLKVAARTKTQTIEPIEKAWEAYKKSPEKTAGLEILPDLEDRVDTLTDIKELIATWIQNNPGPLCEAEKKSKNKLDSISVELEKALVLVQNKLPEARKAHTTFIIEKLTTATDKEKKELAEDGGFLVEMSRTVPVEHINKVRAFLKLDPIKEEKKDEDPKEAGPEWKDADVLAAFKEFEKVATFSEDVNHRKNPEIETLEVTFPAGASVYAEASKKTITLNEEFTFVLVSEDKKGRMKLKAGKNIYYASRADMMDMTHYEKSTAPLFNGTPSKNDVSQGGLGDCYMLAAVLSLVNKDPKAIEDMMLDKGDTVTVRLFHVTANQKGEKAFKARYFSIEKSVVKTSKGGDAYASGALWGQMLEKAYAAGKFVGDFESYKGNLKTSGKFKDIEGGFASFAMEVLTGRPAALIEYHASNPTDFVVTGVANTDRGNPKGPTKNFISSPWGTDEKNGFKKAKSPADYKKLTSFAIMGDDLEKTKKWFQFVNQKSIPKLFKREYSGDYSGTITLEDFELLFQGKMKDVDDNEVGGLPVLDAGVAALMMDWLKAQKLYPGKRGSGIYSALQLSLYNEIKTALDANNMVSLGSKTEVGRVVDGTGHSGGESMTGGLVGGHAYSVFKYKEDNAPQKDLLLRNPWGNYVQKNLTVKDQIAELRPRLKELIKEEITALKTLYDDNRNDLKDLVDKFKDPVTTEKEKKELKVEIEDLKLYVEELKTQLEEMSQTKDFEIWEGKLSDSRLDEYDKLMQTIKSLRKKDADALISKSEDQSSQANTEKGEFWMMLDDVTHRFDQVYVG